MDTQPPTSPPVGGRRPQAHVLADYSGRGAAGVADELRRIGLRPGVQRVDATTPAEVGAILAQDPPMGASAARNSVITLYVGAAPHDPASTERQVGDRSRDATAADGRRRRRKPGHAHALNSTPETRDVATRAEPATDTGSDEEAVTPSSASIGAAGPDDRLIAAEPLGHIELEPQDRVALVAQRVHRDSAPSASATPPEAPVPVTARASTLDARTLLTPLAGLPGRLPLKRWRRTPRRARIAIVAGVVCALALLTLALAGHSQPPAQRAATTTRRASPAAKQPTAGHAARRPPRSHRPRSRPHAHRRAPHAFGSVRADRPARPITPAPTVPPAQRPVTPPAAPVPVPAAPVVQTPAPATPAPATPAPVPATPAVTAPVAVDGQVPGGPFSP